ncbi:unnamed protein product [Prorocentrum cordatum]|uniref:Cold-shock domain-containing protein n=1 Tax=Prorocentrum cordatum TaxID=2364126 RepID=A0ABN9QHG8_9DINO|nr:unnamed protein product [Polarella glacialis]
MCFGVIKSWNQEKGFGFVASPDLAAHGVDGDAYLHISQKGDHEVGSEVAFTLQLVNGRPQARSLKTPEEGRAEGAQSEALGQAEKEMMGQLQAGMGASAPGKGHDPREQVLGTWVGTIKSYNHEKKFGFLSCIELNAMSGVPGDVYLHDRVMTGFAVRARPELPSGGVLAHWVFRARPACRLLEVATGLDGTGGVSCVPDQRLACLAGGRGALDVYVHL